METLAMKAVRLARERHDEQEYANAPYTVHLTDVADHVFHYLGVCFIRADLLEKFICAAWLHDILEDTDTTKEELESIFGSEIANLVDAVTDEPGKNRKERKSKTYIKIRQYGKDAVFLKLCDREANIRSCIRNENDSLLKMYKKEHKEFKERLYKKEDGLDYIWNELEALLV